MTLVRLIIFMSQNINIKKDREHKLLNDCVKVHTNISRIHNKTSLTHKLFLIIVNCTEIIIIKFLIFVFYLRTNISTFGIQTFLQ